MKSFAARSLSYEKARSLVVGSSTENDVVAKFGSPTARTEEGASYTLRYDDPTSGLQRLSINFSAASHKISSLLWIPSENEKEASLAGAKAGFKNADFKEVMSNGSKNPHAIEPETVSYMDEKSGITIRYDRDHAVVEAIAMYDANLRSPAKIENENKIPYTFGDEPTISK